MTTCEKCKKYARAALLERMYELSEDMYAAGWMSGIEHELWALASGVEHRPGYYGDVGPELMELAQDAGGWWRNGEDGQEFVELDKWMEWVAELKRKDPAQ